MQFSTFLKMFWHFCIILLANSPTLSRADLFRKLTWDVAQWRDYIYATSDFSVKTIIECGSFCKSKNCQIFLYLEEIEKCYIGHTSNTKIFSTNELTGEYPIHITKTGIAQSLQSKYVAIKDVINSTVWQRFVYKVDPLKGSGDWLDCSAACSGSEATNGCAFFVFQDGKCFFASMSYSGGVVDPVLTNSTLLVVPSFLTYWSAFFLEQPGVYYREWTRHIQLVSSELTYDQCLITAKVNNWQYFVHNAEKSLCYLGYLKATEQNTSAVIIPETATYSVWVNIEMMSGIFNENFRMRSVWLSLKETVYKTMLAPDLPFCSVTCTFDINDQCDYFYFLSGICYFGSFNHKTGTIATVSRYSVYVNKYDITPNLMAVFTNYTMPSTDFSCHISDVFVCSTYLECAAFSNLEGQKDFFFFDDITSTCYNGFVKTVTDPCLFEVPANQTILVDEASAKNKLPQFYDSPVDMDPSLEIWTRWSIYEIKPGDSLFSCSFLCSMAALCHFYALLNGNCYLGRYDTTGQVELTVPMTYYHRMLYANDNAFAYDYWNYCCLNYISQWIYKTELTNSDILCRSNCIFDPSCHFTSRFDQNCYYGNYDYTGIPIVFTNNTGIRIWFRPGYDNLFDPSATHFDSYSTLVSPLILKYLPFFWFVTDEWNCAKVCILDVIADCHFYVYTSDNVCNLGRFSRQSLVPTYGGIINDDLVIKVRKDYNISNEASKIASPVNGCLNSGYQPITEANANFSFKTFSAKGSICKWQVYAPGAIGISVNLTNINIASSLDYFEIMAGIGGGKMEGEFDGTTTYTTPNIKNIDAEFIYMYWYRKSGNDIEGVVKRID